MPRHKPRFKSDPRLKISRNHSQKAIQTVYDLTGISALIRQEKQRISKENEGEAKNIKPVLDRNRSKRYNCYNGEAMRGNTSPSISADGQPGSSPPWLSVAERRYSRKSSSLPKAMCEAKDTMSTRSLNPSLKPWMTQLAPRLWKKGWTMKKIADKFRLSITDVIELTKTHPSPRGVAL